MPATFFRTANGRWRALRVSGTGFLLSAAVNLITRGWHTLPWVVWLLMSIGAFMLSPSEADTPKSRGLILVYVIGFAAVAFGVMLMLVDMGRHH